MFGSFVIVKSVHPRLTSREIILEVAYSNLSWSRQLDTDRVGFIRPNFTAIFVDYFSLVVVLLLLSLDENTNSECVWLAQRQCVQ